MTKLSKGWFLHALLLAASFVILAWPIALNPGLVAGAVGAVVGTWIAEAMIARRYRVGVVGGTGVAIIVLGWLATRTVLASSLFATSVSPIVAIQFSEMLRWATVATGACVLLRGTALIFRVALAVEGTMAVAAVVATVSAHRDGMIARPLAVSDWFWRQGIDPVFAFLSLGIVAAMLLAGLLLHGRSRVRALIQLGLVFLLSLFMAKRINETALDVPQKNAVGGPLQKDKDDTDRNGGGGSNQQGQGKSNRPPPPNSDLPDADPKARSRPAAIVVFHRDATTSGGLYYFRSAAFSQFNGSRLVQATMPGVDPDARLDFPSGKRPVKGVPEGAVGRIEVATDVALLSHHNRIFTLTDAIEVAPKPNPDPARFSRAYQVVSSVLSADLGEFIELPAGHPAWDDQTWELYTELPRDERYHQLAARLQSRLKEDYNRSPLALALTVKQYLEETSTYSFSRKYQGSEPTGEFLFSEDRKGYCVHLAHAAAYLMRALGLPARVSAGYAVEEQNRGSGSALLIKNGDAHAWAELYLQGVGWVPIEISPEQTDVEPMPFEEKDLQQLLGEMARRESRTERTVVVNLPIMQILRAVWAAMPWFLLGLVLFAYGVKAWRLWAPAFSRRRPRVAYRAALDQLSAVGLTRAHGEHREGFASRIQGVAPSMAPLTAGLSGYVLGSVQAPEARAGAPLHRLADAVGAEIRRAVPMWRWLLGLANPISWWWSR